jgi:hypothetical protein
MKKFILITSGLVLTALSMTAQMQRPSGPPPFVGDIPEEVQALHTEIDAIREALRLSRDAAIEALGEDPSREAVMAAVAAWHTENEATLAEMETLSTELRALIQENRPVDVDRPEISEEALQAREELKTRRDALADSRRAAILALGESPTDEAVRAAIEAWRTENADEIASVEALAAEIRQTFRGMRPERPGPRMDEGMMARREGFRENARELRQNRQALREQLQDPALTPEERRTLMQQFRDEQQEVLQARRELLREKRAAQAGAGGDRRPGG